MHRPDGRTVRTTTAALILALAAGTTPAASSSARGSATRGCHAWAPVFRPVLTELSLAKILVALPASVPTFRQRVYPHANVLHPPLTYDAVLSTKAGTGWPVPARTVLLAVHGSAGISAPPSGSRAVVAAEKTLYVGSGSRQTRSSLWRDRAAGITYTLTLPTRLGRSTLLRVAASLTPGPLRPSPITVHPLRTGFNPCP